MKIFLLPVSELLQPRSQPFVYPVFNRDYGVEQDFLRFLQAHPELCTENPKEADFHCLPVFWTRWHLNHDYGKTGLDQLQSLVDSALQEPGRTFTVCQYDDGPVIDLHGAIQFLASRKSEEGIDIPLLGAPIPKPFWTRPKKRYLAGFIGRKANHPVREELFELLSNRKECFLYDGNRGMRFYRRKMLQAYIALCPRGYGGSSFRFFEAMQLGIVPMHIGSPDTRPFPDFIDWNSCSLYAEGVETLIKTLEQVNRESLMEMGRNAGEVWKRICFSRWPHFLIKELEAMA